MYRECVYVEETIEHGGGGVVVLVVVVVKTHRVCVCSWE